MLHGSHYIEKAWGSGGSLPLFVPSRANDPAFQRWFARFERLGASPAAVTALVHMNRLIDISNVLPAIRVPTLVIHRTQDVTVNVECGARYLELPGNDHPPMSGDNADEIADAIQEFLTGSRAPVQVDRVLATVLFTDIVGSTEKPPRSAIGIGAISSTSITPRDEALLSFRGHQIKTTGDGILATFDGPARAVRCADYWI